MGKAATYIMTSGLEVYILPRERQPRLAADSPGNPRETGAFITARFIHGLT